MEEKFDRKHISLKKIFIVLREVSKPIFNIFLKEKISFEHAKFAKREIIFHHLQKIFFENAIFLEELENLGGRLEVSKKIILAKKKC